MLLWVCTVSCWLILWHLFKYIYVYSMYCMYSRNDTFTHVSVSELQPVHSLQLCKRDVLLLTTLYCFTISVSGTFCLSYFNFSITASVSFCCIDLCHLLTPLSFMTIKCSAGTCLEKSCVHTVLHHYYMLSWIHAQLLCFASSVFLCVWLFSTIRPRASSLSHRFHILS